MEQHLPYPPSPVGIPADFTKPGKSYQKRVWIASAGILSFVILYLGFSGWLLYKSFRLFANTFTGGDDGFLSFVVGVITGFLGVFMVKALFFITRSNTNGYLEIDAAREPRLFAFIYRIADEVGAPRPHKVFLSNRVNAAVFYDISFINLFFPTRKNLEIGLGLVNTLNLGEFKAILAHEFGHFTQRSMIIGRWVYIAQQVAHQIVAKRDGLDRFLATLSGVDFRVAWVGWLLSILVWAIRAVSETFFRVVVITERALSQEMEFNADRVAVSLGGSDAIVNALYKLNAADEAYDNALAFVNKQLAHDKRVSDIFLIQENAIAGTRIVLNNAAYGATPEIKGSDSAAFRVFREQVAQAPKMWSTHPANTERERHAKAIYIAAEQDTRSSWILFEHPAELKQEVTSLIYNELKGDIKFLTPEEGLALHQQEFERSFLLPQYRGLYFGRFVTLGARRVADLYGEPITGTILPEQWQALYPATLQQELEQLKSLEEELEMLEGLLKEQLDASDGRINYRGRELSRKELPEAIAQTERELEQQRQVLEQHDRFARTLHKAAAERVGQGWPEYLAAVTELLHFSEHATRNIQVLNRHYLETLSVASRIRNISSSELLPLLRAANELGEALQNIYHQGRRVMLTGRLLEHTGGKQMDELLESFRLGNANGDNINDWIGVAQGWVNQAYSALNTLREASLHELLHMESSLQRFYEDPSGLQPAPAVPVGPGTYTAYDPSVKREVSQKVDLVSRFYNADGFWPALGRLAAALSLILGVILFSYYIGRSSVYIYNGLPVDVIVDFAGKKALVPAGDHKKLTVEDSGESQVNTLTVDGQEVEHFVVDVSDQSKSYVYNVASAAVIYKANVYYGFQSVPDDGGSELMGARRWFDYQADYYFEEPPESVSLKAGTTEIKSYLSTYQSNPAAMASALADSSERAGFIASHVLWEKPDSPDILSWLNLLEPNAQGRRLLEQRLVHDAHDIAAMRQLQEVDTGDAKIRLCAQQQALSRKNPNDADLYYLACRCQEDEAAKDSGFLKGNRRWPDNKWLAYASAACYAQQENWTKALTNYATLKNVGSEFDVVTVEDRRRITSLVKPEDRREEFTGTSYLSYLQSIEESNSNDDPQKLYAFKLLREGKLSEALDWSRGDSSRYYDMLALAAVSDGANPGMVQEIMSMPPGDHITRVNLIPLMALYLNHGTSIEPFRRYVRALTDDDVFFEFAGHVKAGNVPAADRLLYTMMPEMKAKACLLGILVQGGKVPTRWNVIASRMLFDPEKPYRRGELYSLAEKQEMQ